MKIYVASSWRNEFQAGVVQALREDGHEVYDFKGPGDGWGEKNGGPVGFRWTECAAPGTDWQKWTVYEYLEALEHPRAQEGFRRSTLEDELVSVKKMYASKQAEADAKVSGIATRISSGFEMRTVRCMLCDERPEGYRLTIRLDTGHVARRRKLEQHERQIVLTTEPPAPFVAIALLPVDDEGWETDVCQIQLRQDEFDTLRTIEGLTFDSAPAPVRGQIEGPKEEKKHKGRK
jgi:hypothetical protein